MPDGEAMTESAAMLMVLGDLYPGKLLPAAGTPERAQAYRWWALGRDSLYFSRYLTSFAGFKACLHVGKPVRGHSSVLLFGEIRRGDLGQGDGDKTDTGTSFCHRDPGIQTLWFRCGERKDCGWASACPNLDRRFPNLTAKHPINSISGLLFDHADRMGR